MTNVEAVKAVVAEVEKHLGPVDLLVNNAAVGTVSGPLWETDPEDWWHCLDVNLHGPFLCTRAVLPSMVDRKKGRIINVASGAGLVPIRYFSAYVISKTALMRFTEIVAKEVEEHGIRVFSVDPGTVRTAMAEEIVASDAGKKWIPWLSKIFEEGQDVPPEKAARLVKVLASGQADAISGRLIGVSDDVDAMIRDAAKIRREGLHTLRLHTQAGNS